ncbi:beta-galactosidase-1-like protein 2 [Anoplophora glabripennis]|uniref:beta-galactosidase-1-like protein 2 n=1 Tax=Anoplophora glabripennis TaxID=217634 RepID=UPI000873F8D0|nr:beta-galactosidase-1-like protein 2 [Anoplophora glabripennis]
MALAAAALPTLYEYYTGGGVVSGLSDKQPYFTLNDKNITIYSGAFHYFRVPRANWRDRLRKMRSAGLNTVETYVPWNLHEYQSGVYDFGNGGSEMEDFLHLEEFLKTAQEEDLFALVRPGPYICAEWEFGGLPSWILRNTSSVRNSKDENYLSIVKRYFNALFAILTLLQFQKGGPIIGFQIENEYGNTGNDDTDYLLQLKQMYLDNGIVELLYTSDPPGVNGRGGIPDILQTANFNTNPKSQLDKLNTLQTNKPTMTMEYWTGWFDHWLEDHHTVSTETFKERFEEILDYPSSVNMYMFVGSTNFGFLNGANSLHSGDDNSGLQPTTSSYDYDAPLTEYGDYSPKYTVVKEAIAARNPVQTKIPDPPQSTPPKAYETLAVEKELYLSTVIKNVKETFTSEDVIPMELLPMNNNSGQSFGYIVYRKSNIDIPGNAVLKISGYVRDTVLVLINGNLINSAPKSSEDIGGFGFWKLKDSTLTLTDTEIKAATLDIVVENFGRNNYGGLSQFRQFKGLTEPVYINDNKITDWELIPLEFKKQDNLNLLGWQLKTDDGRTPALYKSTLTIEDDPQDTFIDMRDWYKGIVIVNGFVIGRHFYLGPQQSLYIPAPFLVKGKNDIVIFEHFTAPDSIKFSDSPIFGKPSH